jgi:PKD repeat protein
MKSHWTAAALLVASCTAPLHGQTPVTPLEIDHPQVGCLVAEQYPKLHACFLPGGELAKGEVYFRAEQSRSGAWYRVISSRTAEPGECHEAILPKPKKALIGQNVLLYFGATGRTFGESRTGEYAARVVKHENECKSDKPFAPYVPKASVRVLPEVAPEFAVAGGFPVLPVVGGAAALGTGAAFVAGSGGGSGSDGATPTPPPLTVTVVTPTPMAPPPTVPTDDRPPTIVCRTVPDPPTGPPALNVDFNVCRSEDPEGRALSYRFDFGDGGSAGGFCRESHTYNAVGSYNARLCVSDGTTPEVCCTETVLVVAPPSSGGGGSCTAPTISFVTPRDGFVMTRGTIRVVVSPTTTTSVQRVDLTALNTDSGARASTTLRSAPWEWLWDAAGTGLGRTTLTATVTDTCSTATASVSGAIGFAPFEPKAETALVSTLELPESSGRVVVNGGAAAFLHANGSSAVEQRVATRNRVEAVLIDGKGAGRWVFRLRGGGGIRPGTLHVQSGEVALVTGDSLVFRLAGRPGEHVAFTFETEP